jgi:hypothetical protein
MWGQPRFRVAQRRRTRAGLGGPGVSAIPRPRTRPASLDHIAANGRPRLGLGEADVRSYLTENIYYHLDAPCLEGLQLFYRYAAEIGALPCRARAVLRRMPQFCPRNADSGKSLYSAIQLARSCKLLGT